MLSPLAAALTEALQDEYKACATYRAILEQFGPVRPFINGAGRGRHGAGHGRRSGHDRHPQSGHRTM